MAFFIDIEQLELAINRLKKAQPVADYILPPDLRLMAEVYGAMIYSRQTHIDVEAQPADKRRVLLQWIPAPSGKEESNPAGAVCAMRPGDPGFDGCEACQ